MVKKILMPVLLVAVFLVAGCTSTANTASKSPQDENTASTKVKEFSMDSFYTMTGGKPNPQYSLKEITVNKGDTVRIHITTINGTHDFNIDEFGVHKETPTGQTTTIEFVADKSGTFEYYCSMPNHRANGHWGILKVV